MTIAPDHAECDALRYPAMRDIVERMREGVPGKLEITKEGIVHDMISPGRPHELTAARISRRLEKVMPDGLLAHTGTPDVEDMHEGVMRHPDIMVIAEADMEVRVPSTRAPSSPPSKWCRGPTPTTTGRGRHGTIRCWASPST
ncbi:hypothetical protein GCM10012280_13360 [Wenjunlia tyrosinilytica]|uniref:Uncharacterized protein n=1 Tax=Wenjunlia tyrosinilytica TaxID=1544741 RepID=A0A917ZIQ5_9ACTN|nr:hypothetical protein GCM10012280_13360 [Wenjunlia tyrosinilytica]